MESLSLWNEVAVEKIRGISQQDQLKQYAIRLIAGNSDEAVAVEFA